MKRVKMKPLEPKPRTEWKRLSKTPGRNRYESDTVGWLHEASGATVLSSAGVIVFLGERSPQHIVSVTQRGPFGLPARPTDEQVQIALDAFRPINRAVEEDNHMPGNARLFFLPVFKRHQVECECKANEVLRIEPDGYTYSYDGSYDEDAVRNSLRPFAWLEEGEQ